MNQKIKAFINNKFWKLIYDKPFIKELHFKKEKPFEFLKPDFGDLAVNKSYEYDNKQWYHREYIYKIERDVLIEPEYGYLLYGFNKIIGHSVIYPELYPSFIKNKLQKKKIVRLDKAVLFDGNIGTNYFHFFSDLINKIWVNEKHGLDPTLPLIIGESIYKTRFFQYFCKNTSLKNLNWHVQDNNTWIKSREVYISRPMPYDGSLWLKTLSLLDIIKDNAGSKRVFLTRAKNAGRYISNFDEILPMLNEYKFEIYDTNDMPFEEQVVLFSKIKYLISIHGAGETNICFSYKNNLSMLEINPGNRIACQYYWMANMLNYKYNVIMGNNLESLDKRNEGGFYLSPEKFRNALEKMFNERN